MLVTDYLHIEIGTEEILAIDYYLLRLLNFWLLQPPLHRLYVVQCLPAHSELIIKFVPSTELALLVESEINYIPILSFLIFGRKKTSTKEYFIYVDKEKNFLVITLGQNSMNSEENNRRNNTAAMARNSSASVPLQMVAKRYVTLLSTGRLLYAS